MWAGEKVVRPIARRAPEAWTSNTAHPSSGAFSGPLFFEPQEP